MGAPLHADLIQCWSSECGSMEAAGAGSMQQNAPGRNSTPAQARYGPGRDCAVTAPKTIHSPSKRLPFLL